jgi:hypothetical protein
MAAMRHDQYLTWDVMYVGVINYYDYLAANSLYSSNANRIDHAVAVVGEELGDWMGYLTSPPGEGVDFTTEAYLEAKRAAVFV